MQIETEKCGCLSQNYFFFSNLVDVIAALITSFFKAQFYFLVSKICINLQTATEMNGKCLRKFSLEKSNVRFSQTQVEIKKGSAYQLIP